MTGKDSDRIEDLYWRYRDAGGQHQQLALEITTGEIGRAFRRTASAIKSVRGSGPFFPAGTRKPLIDLAWERRTVADKVKDTPHLQALLWEPTRWTVKGRPELDFYYVAREVVPGSAWSAGKRRWVIPKSRRISADAMLVNATDRTPIVAEIKVGGDQNADYALVQALAAAAQLSSRTQRKRLQSEYRDHVGADVPSHLDVYVIVAQPPPSGTRPKLLARAISRATELSESRVLAPWIRHIELLEATATGRGVTFKALRAPGE